jgi:hypothetical protein
LLVSLDVQNRKAGDTRPVDWAHCSRHRRVVSCVVDAAGLRAVGRGEEGLEKWWTKYRKSILRAPAR